MLAEWYPRLREMLAAAHPRARLPDVGSKAELKDRRELAALVRRDGYAEEVVVRVLKWVWRSENKDAVFWREQVASLSGLRRARDGLSKFDRLNRAYRKAEAAYLASGGAARAAADLDRVMGEALAKAGVGVNVRNGTDGT